MALTDKLTALADAIRAKTGKSDALTIEQMIAEIGTLGETIPEYMQAEADRVASLIQGVRTGNSLTFSVMADMHLKADDATANSHYECTKKSANMAAKTLIAINKQTHIDANILLGDYTYAAGSYTADAALRDLALAKKCYSDLEAVPSAWLIGNHEINYGEGRDRTTTYDELYSYIGSNSIGLVRDPNYQNRNYGYIDFPNQRIRMICLNTADALAENPAVSGTKAPSEGMSAVQLQWLADVALNISDASEWGIVICSHHPLTYNAHTKRAMEIIEAYRDGENGTISYTLNGIIYSVPYDFTSGDKAEIICNIHGHSHNFRHEKIGLSEAWLWRFCMPCINVTRENECATSTDATFAQKWGEFNSNGDPVYYNKATWSTDINGWIWDEDNGTSYCIMTIDRDAKKIYAHYVGTGIDRVETYDGTPGDQPDTPTYTNLVPTAKSTVGGTEIYNGIGYMDGKYASSGGSYGNDTSTTATGYIDYAGGYGTIPTIYIKGVDINPANNSHNRMYFFKESNGTVIGLNMFSAIDSAHDAALYFTIDTLDASTHYYRMTPKMDSDGNSALVNKQGKVKAFFFSAVGSGANLIVTLDQPIV
jgi:hypothetical protein